MNEGVRKFVEISKIRLDGSTQPRCAIGEDTVADYAEAMRDGASFPPVVAFNDGSALWLADGFHRYHATRAVGMVTILVEERPGTRRDAILYGFGANVRHGLRETRADKQFGRAWHLFKDIAGVEPPRSFRVETAAEVPVTAAVRNKIRSLNIRFAKGRRAA